MSTRVLFRHVSVKVDTLRALSISIYALHTCKFIRYVCVCVCVYTGTKRERERDRERETERERERFAKKAARGGDVVFLLVWLLWPAMGLSVMCASTERVGSPPKHPYADSDRKTNS